MKYTVALLVIAALSLAQTATQSDWSAGPVQPGPVTSWGNAFSGGTSLVWSTAGQVTLLYGIQEHLVDSSVDAPATLCPADIDGDGFLDIVTASYNGSQVIWYENALGGGTSWTEHLVDGSFGGAYSVYCADVDGDGDQDIFCAGMTSNDIACWKNDGTGTTWTKVTIDANFSGARGVCAADVEGDGDIDAIGASWNGNMVSWWANTDGAGNTWTEHVVDATYGQACWVRTADVDGDGYLDILGTSRNADDITWWENVNGTGLTWTERTINGSFDGACCVEPVDMDGDGDIDVAGAALNENSVTWFQNTNGAGTSWSEKTIINNLDEAYGVDCADMDLDGDFDVIAAAQGAGDVMWWANLDGAGGAWTPHILEDNLAGARCVLLADFDVDARMDVAAAGFEADQVYSWDLGAFPPNGILESSILDTNTDPDWGILLWSAQAPAGTSVWFQVRASDNSSSMGAWSDTIVAPGSLSPYLADGGRYFQYRAILNAFTHNAAPTLLDMTLSWTGTGVEGGPGSSSTGLLPFCPNPQQGVVQAAFELAEPSTVTLSVYDLAGRMVAVTGQEQFDSGSHTIQLGELQPGIYLCRMTTGDLMDSGMFVVVEQ